MSFQPTALELASPEQLKITWNDGVAHLIAIRTLREACPCASCREKRQGESAQAELLPVLRMEETLPVRITNMRPVGNYAYNISFSDGHDTGIYTLEFLRELGASIRAGDANKR